MSEQNVAARSTSGWQAAGWLLALAAQGLPADTFAAEPPKRYALERSGFLQLKVPAGWREEVETAVRPHVINFRPAQGEPFIVSVIPAQAAEGSKAPARARLRS